MHDYHDLLVWQKAFELAKTVYVVIKRFPPDERFALTDQVRRAVVSVVANIAEGRGRFSDKDFLKFLYIARGSLNETQCQLELAHALGYLPKKDLDQVVERITELSFLLMKFIKSINSSHLIEAS